LFFLNADSGLKSSHTVVYWKTQTLCVVKHMIELKLERKKHLMKNVRNVWGREIFEAIMRMEVG